MKPWLNIKTNTLKRSQKRMQQFIGEANRAAPFSLEKVLRTLRNYCQDHAPYTDRTGNLRNSISFTVLYPKESRDVSYPQSTVVSKGPETKAVNAEYVTASNPTDSVLGVVFAGMEYGPYVENLEGRWVISGSISEARKAQSAIAKELKERVRLKFKKVQV